MESSQSHKDHQIIHKKNLKRKQTLPENEQFNSIQSSRGTKKEKKKRRRTHNLRNVSGPNQVNIADAAFGRRIALQMHHTLQDLLRHRPRLPCPLGKGIGGQTLPNPGVRRLPNSIGGGFAGNGRLRRHPVRRRRRSCPVNCGVVHRRQGPRVGRGGEAGEYGCGGGGVVGQYAGGGDPPASGEGFRRSEGTDAPSQTQHE